MIGGSFGAYILSVTGAVILLAVAEMIMPDGQTAKYVRSALSLILTLIIISPLPNLLRENSAAPAAVVTGTGQPIEYNQSYIAALNTMKARQAEEGAVRHLAQNGFGGARVTLDYSGGTEGITVTAARADVSDMPLPQDSTRAAYLDGFSVCLASYLKIEKGRVFIYGTD